MKKLGMLFLFMGMSTLLLASCGRREGTVQDNASAEQSAYHRITAEEAKEMMDGSDTVIVVDVRTQDEYDQGHIENAVLIPNETIGDSQPEALPDLDQVILVYCRTGVRSRQASEKLVELGYTAIYDMGGIRDWPYETVGPEQETEE